MEKWRSKLFLLLLFSHLSSAISFNHPSHGCYWTESCQNKWVGGCGAGHVIINQSDDCNGLCPEPRYPPCLPFHTHFHCCKTESPKVTDKCSKCKNKIDYGDEYICCTDCSDPYVTDKNTKLGYCKTGAELAMQLKPKVFKWVAGPWMQCSSPCDGGVRYRDVECFGVTEDLSIPHYPVDDSRCSREEMPARQEPCNLRSCAGLNTSNSHIRRQNGMSAWVVTFFVLVGVAAVGGLGFAGYTLYKRRTSSQHGYVYIMLEGYS
ncbi:PREDICTED: ADAMTS-like protein 2 isoform X2 [Nelumbo nucifera]|uniref:Papilin-like n=2 Tax=Nelumbo nucifera TaxID=4432 RepID=A0A822Y6V1_NELNU|nr:PREDICTED: ADAMTS-like protein 2 isoform X2 [Nelumbo nucifera]DAD27069.1 TPA_asm: hypothetical protein HUJ06_028537 [Nelumbo nucifera]